MPLSSRPRSIWEKCYVRIDILRREGDTLHLIEVKSSSIDAEEEEDDATSPFLTKHGEVRKKWKKYLIDVAFQARVLRKAFPEFEVKPWLCVVNKGHKATANETMAHFSVIRDEENPKARPEVVYSGDLQQLQGTGLLALRDVSVETDLLMQEVEARAVRTGGTARYQWRGHSRSGRRRGSLQDLPDLRIPFHEQSDPAA